MSCIYFHKQIFASLKARPCLGLLLIPCRTSPRTKDSIRILMHLVFPVGSQLPYLHTHKSSKASAWPGISRANPQLFSNFSLSPSSLLMEVYTLTLQSVSKSILSPRKGWLPGLGTAFIGSRSPSTQKGNIKLCTHRDKSWDLQVRQAKPSSTQQGWFLPSVHSPLCPQGCSATAACLLRRDWPERKSFAYQTLKPEEFQGPSRWAALWRTLHMGSDLEVAKWDQGHGATSWGQESLSSHRVDQPRAPSLIPCTSPQVKGPNTTSVASLCLDQGYARCCLNLLSPAWSCVCSLLPSKSLAYLRPHRFPTPTTWAPSLLPFSLSPHPHLCLAQHPAHSGSSGNTDFINHCWVHDSFSKKFNQKLFILP